MDTGVDVCWYGITIPQRALRSIAHNCEEPLGSLWSNKERCPMFIKPLFTEGSVGFIQLNPSYSKRCAMLKIALTIYSTIEPLQQGTYLVGGINQKSQGDKVEPHAWSHQAGGRGSRALRRCLELVQSLGFWFISVFDGVWSKAGVGPGQVWNRSGPDPAEVSDTAGEGFRQETGWRDGSKERKGVKEGGWRRWTEGEVWSWRCDTKEGGRREKWAWWSWNGGRVW